MKPLLFAFAVLLPALLGAAEPIALFNGKDLAGWTPDVPKFDKDPTLPPSFIVRDGLLVSMGLPAGHLVTDKIFSNYQLVVEYRFPKDGGNCGVLVHASKPRALYGMFPQSIECQMLHDNAGDFWCICENIEVPDMAKRRPCKDGQQFGGGPADARRIIKWVAGIEKPLGEWNTMQIECKGAEITIHVNGVLMNHGTHCTATSGKIALQAEGTQVEFRKVELTPLTKP